MICPVHRHAQARPAALALHAPDRQWTYAALDDAVSSAQQAMERGDRRVAFAPSRTAQSVIRFWALWRTGATAVPLSSRLPPAERRRQAEHVGADVGLQKGDGSNEIPKEGPKAAQTQRPPSISGGQDATIVFTSGSTGRPKAALHTWTNHVYSAKGANANLPLRPGDRWLLSLPLYHVGGLAILVRCALAGAAVALPDPDASLGRSLTEARATHVSCVPTQLRRLLEGKEAPPAPLRALLLGGGPLPVPLLEKAHAQGWPLLASYGCTEMASQVTTTAPGAAYAELTTAGRCLPHRRLRIGEKGEIFVGGPTLFRGYVEEKGVRDPRDDDGWYPTGDRGRLDAQGRLRVLGRMDHMFVSGGENIQPEEIERHLERVDGVERAVVVSVPDAEFGRRPVAFVRAREGESEKELRNTLERTLPRFKIPDAFYALPDRAETSELKVDRRWLEGHARRR